MLNPRQVFAYRPMHCEQEHPILDVVGRTDGFRPFQSTDVSDLHSTSQP